MNKVLKLILIVINFIFEKLIIFTIRSNMFSVSTPSPHQSYLKKITLSFLPKMLFFQNLLIPTPLIEIDQKFSSPLLKKGKRSPLWCCVSGLQTFLVYWNIWEDYFRLVSHLVSWGFRCYYGAIVVKRFSYWVKKSNFRSIYFISYWMIKALLYKCLRLCCY